MGWLVDENMLVKWETKESPMVALSDSQDPDFVLRKLTALDLLLMMVKVWKNLVLRSEQESQSFLDLNFQRISSLSSSSSKKDLREVSIEKDLELGGIFE